jgi:hypothetical protein
MNEIKAEPHALNNVTQTSLRSPSPPWTRTAVLVVGLATLGLGPMPIQAAHAAQPTPVPCSVSGLLGAIHTASSGDTLFLTQTCTYTLTVADNHDPILGDSGLVVDKTLTINGNGATISRSLSAPPFRIFLVTQGGDLTLDNVTVENGNAATQDPKRGRGGGIYNLHKLTINNGVFSNNNADFGGGAIGNGDASEAPAPVVTGALLTLTDSTISHNTTGLHGAGITNGAGNNIQLDNCLITGNRGGIGSGGGGISSQGGTVIVNGSTVRGNHASDGGGIVNAGELHLTKSPVTANFAEGAPPQSGYGGGILNLFEGLQATVTLDHSSVTFNHATDNGGGIANFPQGTVRLTNSPVSGNRSEIDGGGIANAGLMTLDHSDVITNQAAQNGGGIANGLGGDIKLDHSNVTGNVAQFPGGGIFNQPPSTVTLIDSKIMNNTPDDCVGCPPQPQAGAKLSERR